MVILSFSQRETQTGGKAGSDLNAPIYLPASSFVCIASIITTPTGIRQYFYPHFTDGEPETQGG